MDDPYGLHNFFGEIKKWRVKNLGTAFQQVDIVYESLGTNEDGTALKIEVVNSIARHL